MQIMPQYAVIQSHPPDDCPMTNRAVREFMNKQFPKHPALAKRLGVKILLDIHLDPDHKAFTLFEAPNAESVRDFLVQGGFTHYVNIEFHLVTPIQELMKQAQEMPTIY